MLSIICFIKVEKLRPLDSLVKPLKLEVFVADDAWDNSLVVLEVEDQELKFLTVKLAHANVDVSFDGSHVEWLGR